MKYGKAYFSVIIFALTGCLPGIAYEDTKYYELASALTKLSASVEATVRYDGIPDNATSNEIILLSTSHDKHLLDAFGGYKIKVHTSDRHAIVLVCDEVADEAYLEDAGCSAELDRHHWKTATIETCNATLNLAQLCSR